VRWLILAVVAALGLAACGGSQPRTRSNAGGAGSATGGEVIGGGCASSDASSSNGQTLTTPMTCVVVVENGAQFSCPSGLNARTQAGVAATKGCRRIGTVRFPSAWRVVMRQIATVRDCLRRRGDHVIENVVTAGLPGASANGVQSSNRRLVGELVTIGSASPSFVGFTVRPPFNGGHAPRGWQLRTRRNVAVISQTPGSISACAFTG
jgi:hypothetical protein